MDYSKLAVENEVMRASKSRSPTPVKLGGEEFLLASHGTGNGYPLLLENDAFAVQCGEFNQPNFYVTFRRFALWQFGAFKLRDRFLSWAASVGLAPYRSERLSRVDPTFDYQLDLDFDENSFVSQAQKDNKHRRNGRAQTFRLGEGSLVLRVYDKCAEIDESRSKTWFFDLWGCKENVWRVEWQVRKERLRRFGIRTMSEAAEEATNEVPTRAGSVDGVMTRLLSAR